MAWSNFSLTFHTCVFTCLLIVIVFKFTNPKRKQRVAMVIFAHECDLYSLASVFCTFGLNLYAYLADVFYGYRFVFTIICTFESFLFMKSKKANIKICNNIHKKTIVLKCVIVKNEQVFQAFEWSCIYCRQKSEMELLARWWLG